MTVDLHKLKVGDKVKFQDHSVACVVSFEKCYSYISIQFDRTILARKDYGTSWSYEYDGSLLIDGNDIVEVLKRSKEEPAIDKEKFETCLIEMGPTPHQNQVIRQICSEMADFLAAKNTSYNGAAFQDVTLGETKISARDTILVRISDKIRRLSSGKGFQGDNDFDDLLGYLVLLKTEAKLNKAEVEE